MLGRHLFWRSDLSFTPQYHYLIFTQSILSVGRPQVELVSETGGFHSKVKPIDLPSLSDSSKTQGHGSLIAEFVACIRSGKVPNTIASDNIKSLSMVFGAIESAAIGKRVGLA